MHPVVFGITVYHPIMAFANFASTVFAIWLLRRNGFKGFRSVLCVLAVELLGSALGAKIFSILVYGWHGSIWQEFTQGGWRFPGSVMGILLVAYAIRRGLPKGLTLGGFLDLFAPAFALANAIGHVACILHGCCHGTVCTYPWAWEYPARSIAWFNTLAAGFIDRAAAASAPVHPVPLYTFLLDVFMLVWCLRMLKTSRYDGQVMLIFLAVHLPIRAALEFLRFDHDPVRQVTLLIALGAGWMLFMRRGESRLPIRATT